LRECRLAAADHEPVLQAGAGLDDAGGLDIIERHQGARRKRREIAAAIRLEGEQAADLQGFFADDNAVAGLCRQKAGQALVQPHRAG